MAEGVTPLLGPLGQDLLARKEYLSELAKKESQAEGRCGQKGGTTKRLRQSLGELFVADRLGRSGVHGALDILILNRVKDNSHHIVYMHPGHPLPPIP